MVDYSTAIDRKRFDDLDRVFTPDAYIDYRVTGGIDGRFPEVKAWLKDVLPNFPAFYHMLGNFDVRIDGDSAASRTICFNPMVFNAEDEADPVRRDLVRRRVRAHRRGVADEQACRGEVLRQTDVALGRMGVAGECA